MLFKQFKNYQFHGRERSLFLKFVCRRTYIFITFPDHFFLFQGMFTFRLSPKGNWHGSNYFSPF